MSKLILQKKSRRASESAESLSEKGIGSVGAGMASQVARWLGQVRRWLGGLRSGWENLKASRKGLGLGAD